MMACGPSTSWSTALPMSCRKPARRQMFTSAPSSAAIAAARKDDLQGVGELVLAVAVAELEAAHGADQLRVQPVHAGLVGGLLALLAQLLVHLRLGPRHHLLDPRGVEAPVRDQLQQGDPRHLAAHRVERGEHDRLRGVVDDQVDAGGLLQGADVAPLLADDAPLHLLVGDGHRRLGRLDRGLGGAALDGLGHDPAGAPAPASSLVWLSISRTRAAASRSASASIEATSSTRASSAVSPAIRSSSRRLLLPQALRLAARSPAAPAPAAPGPDPASPGSPACARTAPPAADRRCSWRCTSARRSPGVLLGSGLEPDRLLLGLQDQLFLLRPRLLQDALGVRLGHARLLRVGRAWSGSTPRRRPPPRRRVAIEDNCQGQR